MDIDFLIIGQGLAGSLLAWELMQRGARIIIVDDGRENASQVAAGLINPVTGMRLVKSDRVDELLPFAKIYYGRLSALFGQDFLVEKTMLRFLRSEVDIERGRTRLNDPEYAAYLARILAPSDFPHPFQSCRGLLEQKQTGYLRTRALLGALRKFFIGQGCYRQAPFGHQALRIGKTQQWHDLNPKQTIFCEGYRLNENPWFSWLPLQAVKGEILTLENEISRPESMLNFGNWLIPIEPNRYRIGATFDRNGVDTTPTEAAKKQLLQALAEIEPQFSSNCRVIDHHANMRPCTPDRMPLLGRHPNNPNLWIFNGFGSKGSLQIPWYGRHLADAVLNASVLEQHCNIERFYETYFPSRRSA